MDLQIVSVYRSRLFFSSPTISLLIVSGVMSLLIKHIVWLDRIVMYFITTIHTTITLFILITMARLTRALNRPSKHLFQIIGSINDRRVLNLKLCLDDLFGRMVYGRKYGSHISNHRNHYLYGYFQCIGFL